MDDRTWNVLVDAAKEGHAVAMAEGFVMPPALYPLVKGRLVGYVRLRPVYQGQDAATAIGEMSNLAAAARADEVAIFWETQDIAAACEHVPLHPDPGLNALLATADTHRSPVPVPGAPASGPDPRRAAPGRADVAPSAPACSRRSARTRDTGPAGLLLATPEPRSSGSSRPGHSMAAITGLYGRAPHLPVGLGQGAHPDSSTAKPTARHAAAPGFVSRAADKARPVLTRCWAASR